MGKVLKRNGSQQTQAKRHGRATGKFTGQDLYGNSAAPMNARVKELLFKKARTIPPTQFIVVQVDPELTRLSEQMTPLAKAEEAKTLFNRRRPVR